MCTSCEGKTLDSNEQPREGCREGTREGFSSFAHAQTKADAPRERENLLCGHGKAGCTVTILGSLSTRVFKTRTATRSELFPLLTRLHITTFTLLSIFSPLEMISIKIWETPLSGTRNVPFRLP